jgi:carnitine O-acetyltransferase
LIISALAFIRAVRKEELPPDTHRGQPLDMSQYARIFGTARVPTENGCQILADQTSRHMVVMCHSQFYWFDVLDDNDDLIMTERDIALNLQSIVDDASKTPIQDAAKGAIGVLSTENRKIWAGLRDIMTREKNSNNEECLEIVDSALFILCLDYTSPSSPSELCMNMLCGTSHVEKGIQVGTCTNRWYDKLQIIVCKNGSAGINFEHTGVDGHTVLRMTSDVYTDTILRFARSINGQAPSMWTSTSPDPAKRDPASFGDVNTSPRKLEWDMVPELSLACRFAETRLADLIHQNEFYTLEFQQYGKNFITSMGFSPDAFLQMAFQAAYYGLYGRVENTYEPAMTKFFLHGRTEAIRTVSDPSVDFVQKFWADVPADQKIASLKAACESHVNLTRQCAKGLGQDRHLYALFCVWQRALDENGAEAHSDSGSGSGSSSIQTDNEDPSIISEELISTNKEKPTHIPAIFADAGWDKLNNTILSTSNCGNPSLRQFGFGPTSAEGFGIGYIIKDDSISICASSKHRQTKRFVDALESYFLQIRYILKQSTRKQSPVASRAREAEDRHPTVPRKQINRGRAIGGAPPVQAPTEESSEEEDDMLGGCKFSFLQ